MVCHIQSEMKFLLLALTVCVALADKLDLGVLSLAGLKGGKTDVSSKFLSFRL